MPAINATQARRSAFEFCLYFWTVLPRVSDVISARETHLRNYSEACECLHTQRSIASESNERHRDSNAPKITLGLRNRRLRMSSPTKHKTSGSTIFYGAEARFDRWRSLFASCAQLGRTCPSESLDREGRQAAVWASLSELRQWEIFFLSRHGAAEEA